MKHLPLQQGIIYGPVRSRRLGRSLGINLLPGDRKLCPFNCVYCQYGPTDKDCLKGRAHELPDVEEVAKQLEIAFKTQGDLDAITFSGNGEPTLYPMLNEVIRVTRELRDRYAPGIPLVILSSSATVHVPEIRAALQQLDRPVMKLDAGDQATFETINRPIEPINFERIIEGLKALRNVILQVMLIGGPPHVENVSIGKVKRLTEVIMEIRPKEVQLYSVSRPPAEEFVRPISKTRLEGIARAIERKTGIRTKAF